MYSCCYIWFTNPFSLHGGFHSALLGDGGPDTSVTKLDDADVTRTVPRAPCVWFLVDLGSHLPAHFYIAFLFWGLLLSAIFQNGGDRERKINN